MTKDYYRNCVFQGDCVDVMQGLSSNSVDFILTDPPYLTNYRPRSGQTILNDNQADWLVPSAAETYRLLRRDSLCVSFYGWQAADRFIEAASSDISYSTSPMRPARASSNTVMNAPMSSSRAARRYRKRRRLM